MDATEHTQRRWGRRALGAGLWILIVLEWLGMGGAGLAKFMGDTWVTMFIGWGYPAWFTYVVGIGEVSLASALLVPRLASYAAMGLIAIMVGALATVLIHESSLGPLGPVIHMGVLVVILRTRWSRRWRG